MGLYIWTSVEYNIVFIGASIPTLKPLFRGVRMFTKGSSRSAAYQFSQSRQKTTSHVQSHSKSETWEFSNFNSFKKDKGDSSSEENILPSANYTGAGPGQDIKKTTVITIDRDDGVSLSSKGEPITYESQEHRRAPSTEPSTTWIGGRAV